MDLSIDKEDHQTTFKGITEKDRSVEGKFILGKNKKGKDILLFKAP